MHVAINALSITNRSGTGRYAWGLIHGFCQLQRPDLELTILIPSSFSLPKEWWNTGNIRFYSIPVETKIQRIFWEQFRMAKFLKSLSVDILHSPTFIAPLMGAKEFIHIITIHDLTFLKFPQTIPNSTRVYYKTTIPRSIQMAKTIITDSLTVAEELKETSYLTSRITPVHLGVDPTQFHRNGEGDEAILAEYQLSNPYFLFVGTLEPRKNLVLLAHAFSEAKKKGMKAELLLVGRMGWMEDPSVYEQNGILTLGHIPNEYLPALYRNAHALLAPSMYEGFDLPIAEAYACGTPVIASDIRVHHEIAGPDAHYVDINSVNAWADALLQSAQQAKLTFEKPVRDWRQVALETYEVYKEAYFAE